MRQAGTAVAAGAPGMVDPPGIGTEIATAMHGEDPEVRVAFQHAVENQIVQGDRRLQRIADDVVEVEA